MIETIVYYINLFFFCYMLAYAIVYFITTFLASLNLDDYFVRQEHMSFTVLNDTSNYTPISIIVPAYNEELTVVDTINSLKKLDYQEFEIVIVNDGSKDQTLKVLIDAFNLKPIKRPIRRLVPCKIAKQVYQTISDNIKIILIDKTNGGKSDALNMGINACSYPLFICMDADSVLQSNSLKKIVVPFLEYDNTVAVGGNIKVSNGAIIDGGQVKAVNLPDKMLAKFQLIEYLRVFLTSRVAFNLLNGNLIVSGAFGLYNKEAVIKVGGYSLNVIGEDMELIVKLHAYFHKNKEAYHISYVPDAICWTQVPESIATLKNQRRRWHRGMGQSLKTNFFMFLNPSYGSVGMIAYPYFILFEYITPWIEILGLITIVVSLILGIINFQFFIIYLLVYMGFNFIISLVSLILEKNMFKSTMSYKMIFQMFFICLLESFGYRQMCSLFRIDSFFGKHKNSWGEMVRRKNTGQ